MKVEAIPNQGPASMAPELDLSLNWANEVDIASAFVTPGALRRIESALSKARKEKRPLKVRLIFGLYQRFTPPQALSKMLGLQKAYPGKFFARCARNNRFHWKLYAFRRGSARRFYVGSSNLTEDGLAASGELSVKITVKASDAIAASLETQFETLWQEDAFLLDKAVLKKYQKVKRPSQFVTTLYKDDAIAALLKAAVRPLQPQPSGNPRPRLVFADFDLSDETVEIVESETDWDKKGWLYLCDTYKYLHDMAKGAKVLLLVTWIDNPREYVLEFLRVEKTAEIETPDGKYFMAYSRVPHGWRRRYDDISQELSKVGLTRKKIKSDKNLTRPQLETLCRLLHVKLDSLLAEQ